MNIDSFLDSNSKAPTRYLLLLSFCWLAFNLFALNSFMCLWDDDEAAYAGFALRMLETGDWVNPQFTWSDVHRKTPFHFWTIAISYLIFGVNEFAVRFPSALAVLLTACSVHYLARPVFGRSVSSWAAIIFSSSFLVISMGKMSLTDAWLMLFDTLAVLALLNYLQAPHWRWNLLLWSAIALAILVKGPPIILLMGGIWLGLAIFHPQRKHLIGTHPWFFGLFSLLPFALWAWLSYQQDGGKLLTFLYEWYVVQRIGGVVFGQTGPPGYHFVVALIAFLPWLPFFLSGLWRSFRFARRDESSIGLMLWLVFGWIFYELMSSKLPSYAMGAHPAFALATAKVVVDFLQSEGAKGMPKWAFGLHASLWAMFSLGLWLAARSIFAQGDWVLLVSIPLLLMSGLFFVVKNTAKPLWMALWGALSLSLIWGIAGTIFDHTPAKSSQRVVAALRVLSPEPKIATAAMVGFSPRQLRMSFPFYLERSFGKVQEWTVEQALQALKTKEPVIILLGEDGHAALSQALQAPEMQAIRIKKAPDWWSLNDQLKLHPFWMVYNPEAKKP